MHKFRFHLLGFPHTATNREYNACAYTQKILKFAKMMGSRGHTIIHYGNEGSDVPFAVEEVQILTEAERAGWFGAHDRQKLYDLRWSSAEPYWQAFNSRCIEELRPRLRRGDFILSLAGDCQKPIADAFPGSASGTVTDAAFVEYGIGYHGTFSRYRIYESHAHHEWRSGRMNCDQLDTDAAVIPNYFDLADFEVDPAVEARLEPVIREPYYLFCGRVIECKGILVVADIADAIGCRLVIAGQGAPLKNNGDIVYFGHATIEERAVLMTHAIATLMPTLYREPFGGVSVESQLCGTPVITTDHGAFAENVGPLWRCNTLADFVAVARYASELKPWQRAAMKRLAASFWGLEAIAPLYERYFQMLTNRWGKGWYELEDIDPQTL